MRRTTDDAAASNRTQPVSPPITRRLAALAMSPTSFDQRQPHLHRHRASSASMASAHPPPPSPSFAAGTTSHRTMSSSMHIPTTTNATTPTTNNLTALSWNLTAQRKDRKTWTTIRERVDADMHVQQLTTVELEDMLRQLLSIALPNPRIRAEEIAGMLAVLAQVVPLRSELLCSEYTRVVHKCCARDTVLFTATQLDAVVAFYLEFLQRCASWYTASAIRALGLVLHANADRVTTTHLDALVAVLLTHLDSTGVDIDARYAATSCVANICAFAAKTPAVAQYFSTLLRVVVENVRQQAQHLVKRTGDSTGEDDDRMVVKACTCSIKCIFTIIQSSHERLADRIDALLPSLLSSMRQVVGFGLVLHHCDASSTTSDNAFVFTIRPELSPCDSDSSTCGSDTSSSAGSTSASLRPVGDGLLARLRITVLHTLEAIATHFPKALTSSIGLYLPEQTTPYMTLFQNAPSVLTLLLADPSERVRVAAAKCLDAVWEKLPLKQYFRHAARVVAPSTSFATMPKRMSLMLYQVHVTLVYCIQNERDGAPLTQLLKATASVIQHCPYASVAVLLANQRDLSPSLGDILQALASSLFAATSSSDHCVRMASLACFSALLNIQDPIPALLAWMTQTHSVKTIVRVAHVTILCGTAALSTRSFVEELLAIASRPDDTTTTRSLLRVEAMSLLSKIAKNYSPALRANWQQLAAFLLAAFQDPDPNIRLQAIKILENYIKGETTTTGRSERIVGAATALSTAASITTAMTSACSDVHTQWLDVASSTSVAATANASTGSSHTAWLDFMATHVVRAFRDTSHHVRASVCACFTLVHPRDWVLLLSSPTQPHALERFTRLFLQTPSDSSPVVRAAGFRLLGSLCLVPVFKTRAFASAVVALALEALSDATLNVRVRGAWALGNVCTTVGPEAVAIDVPRDALLLFALLPPPQLQQIVARMLVSIHDNDKVASSVARTLGLVSRWFCFEPFVQTLATTQQQRNFDALLRQTMQMLATKVTAGSPKVRWNACHAIAKVLLCPSVPLATATWAPTVFQALVTALAQQANFKVRISAAAALRVATSRSCYGAFFRIALQATVDALETASDLTDVTEFKYKELLETQLSFTLVHLIQLATLDDDALLVEVLRAKPRGFLYDWLFHNLHRMCSVIECEQARAASGGGTSGNSGGGYGHDDNAAMDDSSNGNGATGDVHDVNPVRKDEILAAVRSLLRILHRDDAQHTIGSSRCHSLLYDAKLSLERDVLFSNDDDIGFEL